jgi:hypothetical protein
MWWVVEVRSWGDVELGVLGDALESAVVRRRLLSVGCVVQW